MSPLEAYLHSVHHTWSFGAAVPETSYYPALKNLLDAVGQQLLPRVECVINPKNVGAGIPNPIRRRSM